MILAPPSGRRPGADAPPPAPPPSLRHCKTGGANGVMSDSYIHVTNYQYQYILVLFVAMLTHGVSPDDFKISILIPIPKGARVNKSNASNYRTVALSSILGKMPDIIIIKVQKE